LGLSKRYRDEGYALLCVSTALSDVECVTQDEEEVYQMQFGELFQQLATDKDGGAVVRDDFALEIADMDE
jgi:ferredoxin